MSFLAVETADHPLPVLIFSSIAAFVILIYAIRVPEKIKSLPPQPEKIIEYVHDIYRKNLKNREYGKEDSQNLRAEGATIAREQGASEHTNFGEKPTLPETDPSGFFGIARLGLLNDARTQLFEKGLLLDHFIEENKKRELLLDQCNETILQLQERLDQHPAQIAYRELRKQFTEKSEALHKMRQQMFSLEGQLLALQREQEETDGERTEEIAQLMQKLGEAEEECEKLEEVIAFLHSQVKPAPKKRTRKPSSLQTELFAAAATTTAVGRNRKKSTSSVYFGAMK